MLNSSRALHRKQNANLPKLFTAAQYAAIRDQLKNVHFLQPDYVDSTKINIANILRKWKRYASVVTNSIKTPKY